MVVVVDDIKKVWKQRAVLGAGELTFAGTVEIKRYPFEYAPCND